MKISEWLGEARVAAGNRVRHRWSIEIAFRPQGPGSVVQPHPNGAIAGVTGSDFDAFSHSVNDSGIL
jgi:hypothetical protein